MSELVPTRTEHEPTATDELRRMLDERGVEWEDFDGEPTWMGSDGRMHYARYEFTFNGPTDELTVYHLTPEQAIAATLGSCNCSNSERTETCQMEFVTVWRDHEPTKLHWGVPVVRCSDCACFSVDDSDHDYRTGWWCKRWYTDMVMPDGFCAWASRKESE